MFLQFLHFVQAEPLIPYLLQTIDKASKQTSQTALVTEALYASLLLVKMENVEFKKCEFCQRM